PPEILNSTVPKAKRFISSTATTEDHSQKRNPCFDPVGAPPRPPRTIVKSVTRVSILSELHRDHRGPYPRRSILQSSKLFVCFQLQKGLEVLNLPPDIQEILQHLRMRCRWLKILLATVVKLISLLDKIVTGAQMGVISLIMRDRLPDGILHRRIGKAKDEDCKG
ncbi:hypothetical protein HID58_063516, partial [Brassica napus]